MKKAFSLPRFALESTIWNNRFGGIGREYGLPAIVCTYDIEWWDKNALHRELGPAQIMFDGERRWLCRGHSHRIGGPARISSSRYLQIWYQHGKLHREDGPAISCGSDHSYYIMDDFIHPWVSVAWYKIKFREVYASCVQNRHK